ncbi:hypothetical protein [Stygiolobus azoricus]|uniref:Uncharacterized protein n=1 Tax=Stygiolobus azoricus TaxID=41675 RepID=A0A650CQ70_9CREN|nr:hypothetical protein [Stygiolobus azoricus]QGR19802.1 hypothetical protein D1868_07295 [Stygiolobus azoricus]
MNNSRSIVDIKKRNLNFSSGEKGKNDFIDSIELPPILENTAAEVKILSLLTLSRSFFQLLATSAVKPGKYSSHSSCSTSYTSYEERNDDNYF